MNRLVKSIISSVALLIIGFFVGRFYQHSHTGYHFELRGDKVYTSDFGSVRWEYVTDSIGTPFLDPGTTRISFDDRLIYKAKRGFQENAPYAQNVIVDGDQINWDDGDYRYSLKITLSSESNTGEQNAAHQALSRPDVENQYDFKL